MRKLLLTSAISAISATLAAPTMAASMTCSVGGGTNNGLVYTTTATSTGINVAAGATTKVYYVDNSLSANSSTTNPTPPPPNPYTMVVSGDWCIDTTSGDFTGNIAYGSYKTQTNVSGFPTIDGRQTFVGVNQAFSGTGTWGTNGSGDPTLSFSYFNTTVNGGGASTQTQTSGSCLNGKTNILGKVCTSFATASKDWEGLTYLFTFDSIKYAFTGTLTGTDTSGSGISRNTTTIGWTIDGIDPPAVPVPAAAWLFGSGLIGLAGAARRRSKKV
jgi:hypothetical protein